MSAALRNQLLKIRKEVSAMKAARGRPIDRIEQAALDTLSDEDLNDLQNGINGSFGEFGVSAEAYAAAMARYRTAYEAAAVRLTGESTAA